MREMPFSSTFMPNELGLEWRWLDTLERVGPESVRVRLEQVNCGAGGLVSIGGENITRGFAEDWLGYRGRVLKKRNNWWGWGTLFAAAIAALAASIGAWPVIKQWLHG